MSDILAVTTPDVPGRQVERVIGLVRGNTVRARHIGKDIMAGLKTIVGGEIHEYGKLLAESREQALDRMMAEAKSLGANAILNVRFATSMVMQGSAEMLAYGTAVVLQDE